MARKDLFGILEQAERGFSYVPEQMMEVGLYTSMGYITRRGETGMRYELTAKGTAELTEFRAKLIPALLSGFQEGDCYDS